MYSQEQMYQKEVSNTKERRRFSWGKTFKIIGIVLLILWILFSLGYVARDQWIRFQNNQLVAAYQRGVADSIRTMMTQSENCQRVTLQDGEKEVEFINATCPK